MSASRKLIERARMAGLSPALAEALERELLAPWAWMAPRETVKSEGLAMVALRELESPRPGRTHREPGGWKGRVHIADDFDAPLPKEIEDSFYGDAGSDR